MSKKVLPGKPEAVATGVVCVVAVVFTPVSLSLAALSGVGWLGFRTIQRLRKRSI